DLLTGDRPTPLTVSALGEQAEEVGELVESERRLLADLEIGEVVIPDALSGTALRKEQQVGLDTRACCREGATRQTHDAPEVAVVEQLALGLREGQLVGAEEHSLIQH